MNMLNSRQKLILLICSSLAINIGLWIFLAFSIKPSPYPLILHYNIYFGADYLGTVRQVYTLPAIGLIIIAINSVLAYLLYKKQKIISYFSSGARKTRFLSGAKGSYLLVGILPLIQIFLFIAGITIVVINA